MTLSSTLFDFKNLLDFAVRLSKINSSLFDQKTIWEIYLTFTFRAAVSPANASNDCVPFALSAYKCCQIYFKGSMKLFQVKQVLLCT